MTSQNLAICIAPSLVWSSKSIVPSCAKETTAACEFVQFMIDNYLTIFGDDAARILGDESEIQPPVTYDDDDMPDQNSDNAENDVALRSPENSRSKQADFAFSLRVPNVNITPDGNPTSPTTDRKPSTTPRTQKDSHFYDLKVSNRRHSENDLTDLNDNLPGRKLRAKVPLTSYTATAELIKHSVSGEEDSEDSPSTFIRIVSSAKETSPASNGRRKNSPSNHAIYHRNVRPTPTYEEAMRRRNAQFSPLFSRKFDEGLESSDDSIDLRSEESTRIARQTRYRRVSNEKEDPVSSSIEKNRQNAKLDRQQFSYQIGSPTTHRLKSSKYAADDWRLRSPEQTIASTGNSRHPSSPSYEQHLQRRKRFEAAYLQKINLDLNDLNRSNGALKHSEHNSKVIDFAHSYNCSEFEKTTRPSTTDLAKSLDSSGLRSLRARSESSGQDSVPLSNGIHTFITQRRSPAYGHENMEVKTLEKSRSSQHHETVSNTLSASARLITTQWSESKPSSPLRAAIDVGSFMYRPGAATTKDQFTLNEIRLENWNQEEKKDVWNTEKNNNEERLDLRCERLQKSNGKAAEDIGKLLSSLKSQADSVSTDSSDSVGNLSVPSHEDIKTILCQDESYV